MKHKHYEMGVAKLADTSLVKFIKLNYGWVATQSEDWNIASDYFLCLPKHEEVCLHWLNGGSVQWSDDDDEWLNKFDYADDPLSREYFSGNSFLLNDNKFRIKPKKEKRWIAVNSDGYVMPVHCGNIESARQHASHIDSRLTENVQFIEIEVEV